MRERVVNGALVPGGDGLRERGEDAGCVERAKAADDEGANVDVVHGILGLVGVVGIERVETAAHEKTLE